MSNKNIQPSKVPAGGTDREVPPPIRYTTFGVVACKLTLKDRLKLALGQNVLIETVFLSEQRPGRTEPRVKLTLTRAKDLPTAARELYTKKMMAMHPQGVPQGSLPPIVNLRKPEPDGKAK